MSTGSAPCNVSRLYRFYTRRIFPHILDRVMSGADFKVLRERLLDPLGKGEILEIGFGTGHNLPFYPPPVDRITAIEPNDGMNEKVRRAIEASRVAVTFRNLDGAKLPMADQSFDVVVASWTLCSIPDVEGALAEVRRVLKPGGTFRFVEHGRSDSEKVAAWQDRLTPLSKVVGVGCHLNRDMPRLIENAGLALREMEVIKNDGWLGDLSPEFFGVAVRE